MRALLTRMVSAGLVGALLFGLAMRQLIAPVSLDLPVSPDYRGDTVTAAAVSEDQAQNKAPTDFSEVVSRPLFTAGRKPPAPPPPPTVAENRALSAYSVVGIIVAPDRAVAVLRGPSGSSLHLRKGQVLEGWTLETIESNKLTFVSGDQRQEVTKSNKNQQQPQNGARTTGGMMQQRLRALPGIPGATTQ